MEKYELRCKNLKLFIKNFTSIRIQSKNNTSIQIIQQLRTTYKINCNKLYLYYPTFNDIDLSFLINSIINLQQLTKLDLRIGVIETKQENLNLERLLRILKKCSGLMELIIKLYSIRTKKLIFIPSRDLEELISSTVIEKLVLGYSVFDELFYLSMNAISKRMTFRCLRIYTLQKIILPQNFGNILCKLPVLKEFKIICENQYKSDQILCNLLTNVESKIEVWKISDLDVHYLNLISEKLSLGKNKSLQVVDIQRLVVESDIEIVLRGLRNQRSISSLYIRDGLRIPTESCLIQISSILHTMANLSVLSLLHIRSTFPLLRLFNSLQTCPKLAFVDISGSRFRNEEIPFLCIYLSSSKVLTKIYIRECKIGEWSPEFIQLFFLSLLKSISLQIIDLSENYMGKVPREMLAWLAGNKVLKYVDLRLNGIGDELSENLGNILLKNKGLSGIKLDFSQQGKFTLVPLSKGLLENHMLLKLSLTGYSSLIYADLASSIISHPSLRNLCLNFKDYDTGFIKKLAEGGCFAGRSNLRIISITGKLKGGSAMAIGKNLQMNSSKFQKLTLSGSGLTKEDLAALARGIGRAGHGKVKLENIVGLWTKDLANVFVGSIGNIPKVVLKQRQRIDSQTLLVNRVFKNFRSRGYYAFTYYFTIH